MLDQSLVVRFSLVKERGNCTLIEIIRTKEAHSITGLVSGEKARVFLPTPCASIRVVG